MTMSVQPTRSNRMGFMAALAALVMLMSGSAFADPHYGHGRDSHDRNSHQERYMGEVRGALKDGSLSTNERKDMQKRVRRIEDYKRRAMRDGRLSSVERKEIRLMERQNRQMTMNAIRR